MRSRPYGRLSEHLNLHGHRLAGRSIQSGHCQRLHGHLHRQRALLLGHPRELVDCKQHIFRRLHRRNVQCHQRLARFDPVLQRPLWRQRDSHQRLNLQVLLESRHSRPLPLFAWSLGQLARAISAATTRVIGCTGNALKAIFEFKAKRKLTPNFPALSPPAAPKTGMSLPVPARSAPQSPHHAPPESRGQSPAPSPIPCLSFDLFLPR